MVDIAFTLPQDTFEKLLTVLDALWRNRNNMLWNNKAQTPTDIVLSSLSWLHEFQVVRQSDTAQSIKVKQRWKPAKAGYVKLNVDGSYLPQKTIGGTGGVIRDAQELAWQNVQVESDCAEAVAAVNTVRYEGMTEADPIDDIKELMKT
ncbi:hypothetical protein ACLB2K_066562 [Fragaria x ananassa]